MLEALAGALGRAPTGADAPDPTDAEADAGEDALFGILMQNLMPVLLGVWSGSMIGQLSHQALGQYDLPLPARGHADAAVRRAQRRRLRGGSGRFPPTSCATRSHLREVVHGAQRSVPWVRERLVRLA